MELFCWRGDGLGGVPARPAVPCLESFGGIGLGPLEDEGVVLQLPEPPDATRPRPPAAPDELPDLPNSGAVLRQWDVFGEDWLCESVSILSLTTAFPRKSFAF